MNILPKKRWHVRTKENVAKVRRDEANAAAEERARVARAALAEQEARTQLLLSRARKTLGEDASALEVNSQPEPVGHLNFFEDAALKGGIFAVNAEAELEKKQQKEKEERRIGLLRYLGEGSSEYMKQVPWYEQPAERYGAASSVAKGSDKKEEEVLRNVEKKQRPRGDLSMEELRRQRLAREKEEEKRCKVLFRKSVDERQSRKRPKTTGEGVRQKYSAQFNPTFAKQNRR